MVHRPFGASGARWERVPSLRQVDGPSAVPAPDRRSKATQRDPLPIGTTSEAAGGRIRSFPQLATALPEWGLAPIAPRVSGRDPGALLQ
jgi:hypothetical protein